MTLPPRFSGAATITSGDYANAAELAKNATSYNRQLHLAEAQGVRFDEAALRHLGMALAPLDYLAAAIIEATSGLLGKSFGSSSDNIKRLTGGFDPGPHTPY